MKAISAHITGFYRSSFHAYTTEVNVDGHRWRLGLRYSKFHEFYDQLVLQEPKDFHADFPPKGSLFFTPKPEERQEQLEVFLQQVLAYYAAKGYPTEIEDLLCDLLKVPRHLRAPEHEDDDVSTSTESVLDEPMHEPPTESVSVEKKASKEQKEKKTQVAETEETKQRPVQEVAPTEAPALKEEDKFLAALEPVQLASPVHVADELRPVLETEVAPIAHDEAEAEVETPAPAEETEVSKEAVKEGIATVEQEVIQQEEAESASPLMPAEQSAPEIEEATKEEAVAGVIAEQAVEAVAETLPEETVVPSPEEQSVVKSIAQESTPSEPQAAEEPAVSESTPPKENVKQKELATSGRVSSWIAAYLPKSLLGFIRRRCMKKTNLVVLCVALLLPMVLARR